MRNNRAAAGLGLLAATVAPSLACRQVVDLRDPPPPTHTNAPPQILGTTPGPDAGACGLPYGTETCAACAAAHCCQESTECSKNLACSRYAACLNACDGDPKCRATCGADSPPPSSSEGSALSACLVAQCENECGVTCGAVATYRVPPSAASACRDCFIAKGGCADARACGASADCDAAKRCATGCTTGDCVAACWAAHDAGTALALASQASGLSKCNTDCAFGGDWTCVGHVNWPPSKSDMVTVTVEVRDYDSGSTVSNVEVSICGPADLDCRYPVAVGSTDTTGRVVLHAQASVAHARWNLGSGYLQLKSPDILPTLYYWGWPVTESEVSFTLDAPGDPGPVPVFTPDEFQRHTDSLGFSWDKKLGAISAPAEDCLFRIAGGVQVAITPSAPGVQEFYAWSSTLTATDSTVVPVSFAALLNVPPGQIDVVATPLALSKLSSHQTVSVRAGWQTVVMMAPTP